jgi:hypothetical protein
MSIPIRYFLCDCHFLLSTLISVIICSKRKAKICSGPQSLSIAMSCLVHLLCILLFFIFLSFLLFVCLFFSFLLFSLFYFSSHFMPYISFLNLPNVQVISTHASRLCGRRFKSSPGDRLPPLRFTVLVLSSSLQFS